ncbi:hypothetical protein EMPS_05229 [Entomortierella parvispora]|uniref:M-phase inducer phosphatase n=1 Tax=Entomortierella parvispora TaxID=205924 RepID=A0A9P3HA65_9FUNG|nr:hypothetical protein EMPS_05229 [Entomortierella parvispora]
MTCEKSATTRVVHPSLHAREETGPNVANALATAASVVQDNSAIHGEASCTRDSLASSTLPHLQAASASDPKSLDAPSSMDSTIDIIAKPLKDILGTHDTILQKPIDGVGLDSITKLQIKTAEHFHTEADKESSGDSVSVLPSVVTDTPNLSPTAVQERRSPIAELSQRVHDSCLSSDEANSQTPGKAYLTSPPPRKPRHDSGCASGFFSDNDDSNPFIRRKKSKSSSSVGLSNDRMSSQATAAEPFSQSQPTNPSSSAPSASASHPVPGGKREEAIMKPIGEEAIMSTAGMQQRRVSDISTLQTGKSRPKSQFLDKEKSSFFSDNEDSKPTLKIRRRSSSFKRPVEDSGLFSGDEGEPRPRRKKIARVRPTDYVRATLDNSKSANNHFSLSSTRSAKSCRAEKADMGILDDGDKIMKEVDDTESKDTTTKVPNIHQGDQTKVQNTSPFLTGFEPEPLVRSMTAIGSEGAHGHLKLKKSMPYFNPTPLYSKDSAGCSLGSRNSDPTSTMGLKNKVSKVSSKQGLMLPPTTAINTESETAPALSCSSRPAMLKAFGRSQTMISRREEFMDTLESNRHAAIELIQQGHRVSRQGMTIIPTEALPKVAPFAPPSYVPDPKVKECQILPCIDFEPKPNDSTRRVSPQTVVDILEGKYKDKYDEFILVDCRFPYEYEGGHINGAVNINTLDELEKQLLQPAITDKRVLLIFHCEFSCHRGPRMARHLRNQDRHANVDHYPALFYPEVYVMQSGYSVFFRDHRSHCVPEAYVPMDIVD